MPIENWSEDVLLVELSDDPQFTDDMTALLESLESGGARNVVLDFKNVSFLNSSNIAKLLKLRKTVVVSKHRKLKLCCVSTHVWGVFLVTGLDKIFDVCDDVSIGLASLQLGQ
jgi:anti-anti-sigma factor